MRHLSFMLVYCFSTILLFLSCDVEHKQTSENNDTKKEEKRADKPDSFFTYFQFIKTGGVPQNQYLSNYRFRAWYQAQKLAQTARYETDELIAIERGPSNIGGRTRAVLIDYEDDSQKTWFAGSVGGGIWKTENAGQSWLNLTENLPNLAVSCMVQSPSNPQILYVGTGEGFGNFGSPIGNGIFKTTDKGKTWEQLQSTTNQVDFQYINDLIIHPKNQNILILATQTGIYKTENGGQTWTMVYQATNSVEDLAFHADNFDTLYASVNEKGILKSTDGGKTWKNPILNPVKSLHLPARTALAISPQNPNKIYASTEISASNSALFVSEDAGQNWTKLGISSNYSNFLGDLGWYANVIAVHPFDENIVLTGGVNLFRFTVKNETYFEFEKQLLAIQQNDTQQFMDFVRVTNFNQWDKKLNVNSDAVSVEIRFGKNKKQKAHRFLVPEGRTGGVQDNEYEFIDLVDVPFEVWDITNNRQLAFSFRDQGRDGKFNLIHRNTNSEVATEESREYMYIHSIDYQEVVNNNIAQNGGHQFQNMYMLWAFLPKDAVWDAANLPETTFQIIYDTPKLRRTISENISDAYNEYTGKNQGLHPDHHHLTFIPQPSGTFHILNSNDGGIAYSVDEGKSFENRSNQYNTVQFYGVDKKPNEEIYIGGAQDNGTLQSLNNTIFERVRGGDGFETIWHATDPNKILATLYNNQIYRTQNGGRNWTTASGSISDKNDAEKSGFMTRLGYATHSPDVVFAVGISGVWRSENFGISWKRQTISENWVYRTSSNSVSSVESLIVRPSESSPNYVWAGAGMSDLTNLHVSTDGGLTFRKTQNTAHFQAPLSGLYPHPSDSMTVFALFSVAGQSKILRSTDLGESWKDITQFESGKSTNGFPDVATYSMLVFPKSQNRIWAGTEIGIFESMDNGISWHYLSNLIPATAIWEMKIRDNQIVIGTHGRGIWTINLPENEIVTGTKNTNLKSNTLQIYPNPNYGKFRVRLPISLQNQRVQIRIISPSGRLILSENQDGKSELAFDLGAVSHGIYILEILGKTQKMRSKFVLR